MSTQHSDLSPLSIDGEGPGGEVGVGSPAQSALDLWRQTAEPLTGFVQDAERIAAELETVLRERYSQAEAAGDQPRMSEIVATYDHVKTLGGIIHHQDAAIVGAGVAIEQLSDEFKQAVGELHTIMQAIENQDGELHPAVADLIEVVREDERDNLEWEIEDAVEAQAEALSENAYEEAYETLQETVADHLARFFGCDSVAARRLADILFTRCGVLNTALLLRDNSGKPLADHYVKYLAWYDANRAALEAIGQAVEAALGDSSPFTPLYPED